MDDISSNLSTSEMLESDEGSEWGADHYVVTQQEAEDLDRQIQAKKEEDELALYQSLDCFQFQAIKRDMEFEDKMARMRSDFNLETKSIMETRISDFEKRIRVCLSICWY